MTSLLYMLYGIPTSFPLVFQLIAYITITLVFILTLVLALTLISIPLFNLWCILKDLRKKNQ